MIIDVVVTDNLGAAHPIASTPTPPRHAWNGFGAAAHMPFMTITRKAQTGAPGNKGQFGRKLNTDAEATLERPQPRLIPATEIEVGDELWDSGFLLGLVTSIENSQAQRHLIFANGTWSRVAANERVDIVRTTLPLPYDPYARYSGRLEAACDPRQSAETLERIVSCEAEDDFFMRAVAGHPNATPETIDQAARHPFFVVRMAAVGNPNTSDSTLDRLMAKASESEIHALTRHRNADTIPEAKQANWEATQNAGIVAAIHQRLAG